MKTVTIITSNYPSPGHVANVFVQQLVHAMIEQGVNVSVIAYQSITHSIIHNEKLLPRYSTGISDSGVKYRIFRPVTVSFGNTNFLSRLSKWINKRAITSKVKYINSDILYCHFWSSALPIYEYAEKNHLPLFVACGEGDNALEEMIQNTNEKQLNRLARSVTGVISVSSENKRKCVEFKLAQPDNIGVFPNCVNTNIFHRMESSEMRKKLGIDVDDFVISFVGGFENRKGPDRLASAVRVLNDSRIKVIFIGKPFKGYSYAFDCPGTIHKGPIDHSLIPEYLNCSDIFVLPTQKEGCCNAIVEALAIGLPVISSNRPFNDDILNEKNSICVDPNDVTAIAEAIKTMRDNTALRESMKEYSLAHHGDYSINTRVSRILSFIDDKIKIAHQ